MNIVWMSWKDRTHPLAGGAETVSGEIMDRLARDGHTVTHVTAAYPGSSPQDTLAGVNIVRGGNRYSVYLFARKQYKQKLRAHADIVIDEMNTIPFASGFYSQKRNVLVAYQLARKVWFYQMVFPLSVVGYLLEPLYLRLVATKYPTVLTESESSRLDMARHGFPKDNVHVFQIGMALEPLPTLQPKKTRTLVLSLGAIRPMKRTLHAIKAFEVARALQPGLRMIIAGDASGSYAKKVLDYVKHSPYAADIDVLGRVSGQERLQLMHDAAVILVTSVKEGWGLIVTEANSQGTPAVVYGTDGLRDSVKDGETGILVPDGDFASMGKEIVSLLQDTPRYDKLRSAAWDWSKEFSFEASYESFVRAASLLPHE